MNSKTIILCIALSLIGLTFGQNTDPSRNRGIPELWPVTYGCHRERCWSRCSALGLDDEWCYTSPTRRGSYQKCHDKYDCRPDMICGGPCTRGRK